MADNILVSMPTNYTARVEQIINEYNDAKGLIHGFQKDAIQNAVGARTSNSWSNWKCCIDLISTPKGKFLIVSDYGTAGLTGPNKTPDEIQNMCNTGALFPEDWRLARISANNVSGNNQTGGGLFGIGKTLYSAASNKDICKYYFDSLTKDGIYRANLNDKNRSLNNGALEGNEAKKFIKSKLGLDPIDHVGTRIIICDPKDEIIESIEDGTMLKNIEETWWRIFPYLTSEDNGIFLNGKKAKQPHEYDDNNVHKNHRYVTDSTVVADRDNNYKTKRFGFIINEQDLDEDLRGFFYYRRGMKVGRIKLNNIPKIIEDKYYGYIELDQDWELELAAIENHTHYDVQGLLKSSKCYRSMQNYVSSVVDDLLKDWGYVKDKESKDRALHSLLNELQDKVQNLFKNKGFENLGKGDTRPSYTVRLRDIIYPNPDERKTVYDNDIINFAFNVTNNFAIQKQFSYTILVQSSQGFMCEYDNGKFTLEPGVTFKSNNFDFKVTQKIAEKFCDNNIIVSVRPSVGKTVPPKKIIFYYGIETKKIKEKDFEIIMANRKMPRINDKRVNTGESIKEIFYSITNNLEVNSKLKLNVWTHDLQNNAAQIEKVFSKTYDLKAYETIDTDPFDILFSKEIYEDLIKKGNIDIRARLSVAENNGIYEKGENVGEFKFTIFFNKNEKRGFEDSFEIHTLEQPDNPRRSYSEGNTGNWKIYINIGHPEYQNIDELNQRMYLEKLIIKEFVILYLKEGKYDQIGFTNDPEGTKTSHIDVLMNLTQKIDEIWWESCQK